MRIVSLGVILVVIGCGSERERPLREPLSKMAKASAHHSELSNAIPILNVRNLRESQHYYRDALGFKIAWDYGDPPDFGAVVRGDATMFMCQRCQSTPGAWTMVFTRNVDQLHKELVTRNAIIQMPPTNMPWNLREMQVADPDGNVIRFASSLEHEN